MKEETQLKRNMDVVSPEKDNDEKEKDGGDRLHSPESGERKVAAAEKIVSDKPPEHEVIVISSDDEYEEETATRERRALVVLFIS